jgi:1-acyl-sn-glycerol-3-phosphate acyltransferase
MSAPSRARSNPVRACLRLIGFVVVTTVLMTGTALACAFARSRRDRDMVVSRWTQRWGRGLAALFGIRIDIEGEPPARGVLLAPNHLGYADIVAMAASCPCTFVTKPEVYAWPVIGGLMRFLRIPVVRRSASREISETSQRLGEIFGHGCNVCIFLEGTSTGGDRVLPFRSALVQPAIEAGAAIQPVALTWTADQPGVDIAEDVAYWRPEHVIGPHLWRFLGLRGARVRVCFGEPVLASDRKTVAREVHARVIAMLGLETAAEAAG